MERDYLDNLSIAGDLAILLRTPRRDRPRRRRLLGGQPDDGAHPTSRSSIVSHGAEGLLRRCLALAARAPAGERVDAGHRGRQRQPRRRPRTWSSASSREVRLLRRGNIGFSAANNLVLRESDAARRCCCSTPTPRSTPGTLDAALARLRSEPADRHGRLQAGDRDRASWTTPASAPFPTPLSALAHFTGIGRGEGAAGALSQYRATHLGDDEPGEVDAVNGAFMLCRAEAVREVGLLDEGYWLYMEDLDWCRRFWDAGWKVFYEPAGRRPARQGRLQRRAAGAAAGDRLPPRHGPLLPPLRRPRAQPAAERGGLRRDRRQARARPWPHRDSGRN